MQYPKLCITSFRENGLIRISFALENNISKSSSRYPDTTIALVETAPPEVVRDDHIGDGVEHELNVVGVRGAGHVAVDLLGGALVLGFELGLDVGGRFPVLLSPCGTLHEKKGKINYSRSNGPNTEKKRKR